jgi:ADP-glucose pyrophosphorylase
MPRVICLILGGGRGTRLYPLTKSRSKPAVPIAGKYRLIDIPISNCIHSGLSRIFVLTQFNSVSLHRHIANTYKFDPFGQATRPLHRRSATLWRSGAVARPTRQRGKPASKRPPRTSSAG